MLLGGWRVNATREETHYETLTGRDRWLLLLVTLAVLLPGTMGVGFVDRDEGWYAQVSREMLQTGEWLIPHYLGEPWIAKPPLLYWCVAASFKVFGLHEWAARLISVAAMTGAVQLLARLAAGMCNRRVAIFAGLGFITAGLPAVVGKMLLTDGLLLLWCVAAQAALWRMATRGTTAARAAGFWTLVGLGLLTKGPAILLFVGAFGVALIVCARRRHAAGQLTGVPQPSWAWARAPKLWLALPMVVLVGGPWYFYAARHAGGTLVDQFLWYETASRIVHTPHGHGGPPGYYLLLSLAGWLPWTVLVPGAVIETWRERRGAPNAWLLLLWWGLPWVALELIHSKLPHYVLPCYLPLAVMFGRMWDRGLRRLPDRRERVVLLIWACLPIVLGLGLLAGGTAAFRAGWPLALAASGVVLAGGFGYVAWLVRRLRLLEAWTTAVAATVLFHLVVGLCALPALEPYRLSRNVARRVNAVCDPGTEVLVSGYEEPSMFFYLEPPARVVSPPVLVAALKPAEHSRVLVARAEAWRAGGVEPLAPGAVWQRVRGFNYVKWRKETVWIARVPREEVPGPVSISEATTAPATAP